MGGRRIAARIDTNVDLDDLMNRHGSAVLRMTRSHSRSSADAEDAFQRAFEILLTKPPAYENPDEVLPWLLTVARNEALTIQRKQKPIADFAFEEVAYDWTADSDAPADRIVAREEDRHRREALLRINPDQARCLLLRADGMSYEEISAETGFTFHKVHRSLTQGRRVYRGLLDRIEAGAECRRLEPSLSLLVDGELPEADRKDVDLHLTNCVACQAAVRAFADAPREVASLFPVGAAAGGGFFTQVSDQLNAAATWLNERLFGQLAGTSAPDVAFGKKIAVATAIAGTIVAGGAGVESVLSGETNRAASGATKSAAPAAEQATRRPETTVGEPAAKSSKRRRAREASAGEVIDAAATSRSADSATTADEIGDPPKFDSSSVKPGDDGYASPDAAEAPISDDLPAE